MRKEYGDEPADLKVFARLREWFRREGLSEVEYLRCMVYIPTGADRIKRKKS